MKEPPISKIYEAYSAIADNRVKAADDIYLITSSDYSKTYTVKKVGNVYSSNDNATIWQHYSGYPIVAVLILEQRLPLDSSLLGYFKNIPWKQLNVKYKNDYDKSIDEAFSSFSSEEKDKIDEFCQQCLKQLMSLDIQVKGNRIPLK